jgi:hypothetical protein
MKNNNNDTEYIEQLKNELKNNNQVKQIYEQELYKMDFENKRIKHEANKQ